MLMNFQKSSHVKVIIKSSNAKDAKYSSISRKHSFTGKLSNYVISVSRRKTLKKISEMDFPSCEFDLIIN